MSLSSCFLHMHHRRVEIGEGRVKFVLSSCFSHIYHQRVEVREERGKFEFIILFSLYVSPKGGIWGGER